MNIESGVDSRSQDRTGSTHSSAFLTNLAHVLMCVAQDPTIRLRDLALELGITERAAHRILSDLVDTGHVLREKEGRRNRYQVIPGQSQSHPLADAREVSDLLQVLIGTEKK